MQSDDIISGEQNERPVPLVTIGITCFNAASTIRKAVFSALCQDWPNKEIIVVDDYSTDGSWEILKEIAAQNPVTLCRHPQNKGVAFARNTLIEMADGEFIAYFDDDDESCPHRISTQWKRIVGYESRHKCKHVFCTAVRNVAVNGKIDHQSTALGRHAPEPHGEQVADYFLGVDQSKGFDWGLFGTCTLMARVSVLRELGGFDPEFRRRAEWDMAIRAALIGAHFIAVDEPLVTQYKTGGLEKSSSNSLQYALLLRDKHKMYLLKRGFYRGSRAMAKSNFNARKGKLWKRDAYALLACVLSPAFAWQRLARKFAGDKGGDG